MVPAPDRSRPSRSARSASAQIFLALADPFDLLACAVKSSQMRLPVGPSAPRSAYAHPTQSS
jgi:hypothetical protein